MSPSAEELVDEPPTSINPYRVLDVEKSATADQIKAAYRKLALRNHPDKVSESDKEAAHTRFQEIAFAYAVLSDPRRRSRYDATGRTNESLSLDDDDFNWSDFFRNQYAEVITEASIAKFKKEYQGSEEEKLAVIEAYISFEGDMDGIFESVMLSNPLDDEKRFREIIDGEIKEKRIEGYETYTKETSASKKRRIKTAQKEAEEAREMAREMGVEALLFGKDKKDETDDTTTGATSGNATNGTKGGRKRKAKSAEEDTSGLAALIQQRQKQRAGDFLADLEAKYAPKKRGKRPAEEEPSEEAFKKTQERLTSSKAKQESERPIASPRKKRAKR